MIFSSIYAIMCLKESKDYADIGLGWVFMSTVESFLYMILIMAIGKAFNFS
jgi:hypothetical protein